MSFSSWLKELLFGSGLKVGPYVFEGIRLDWPATSCDGIFVCGNARSASDFAGMEVLIPKKQMTSSNGRYEYIFPVTARVVATGTGEKYKDSYNYGPLTQFLGDMSATPGAAAFLFTPQDPAYPSDIIAVRSTVLEAIGASFDGGIFVAGDPAVRQAAALMIAQNLPDYAKPTCSVAPVLPGGTPGGTPEQKPTQAGMGPVVHAVAIVAAAGLGYLWWSNRRKHS